jgi:hypothetical protein
MADRRVPQDLFTMSTEQAKNVEEDARYLAEIIEAVRPMWRYCALDPIDGFSEFGICLGEIQQGAITRKLWLLTSGSLAETTRRDANSEKHEFEKIEPANAASRYDVTAVSNALWDRLQQRADDVSGKRRRKPVPTA